MNVASRLPDSSAAALADRPMQTAKPAFLGFGLGLRHQHYDEILSGNPDIDWFEVISENYMIPGGQPLRTLDLIRERPADADPPKAVAPAPAGDRNANAEQQGVRTVVRR